MWVEVRVDSVPRSRVEVVAAALWAEGAQGVEERDPPELARPPRQPWDDEDELPPLPRADLRAWFEEPVGAGVEAAVREAWSEAAPTRHPVADVDWEQAGRDAFPRLVVSPHLAIAAPWNAEPGDVVIDPGIGFGTGHHETTAAVLHTLEALAAHPQVTTALDVGCGSGILALAAARLGLRAEGIDIEADAVEAAQRNATISGVEARFSTTNLDAVPGVFDLVLANLHAEVLVLLAKDLIRVTGRHLVLAGILADREARVRAAFDPALALQSRVEDGPWVCLVYERTA